MYPINLIIDDKPCVVVGGGIVAFQKVQSLLDANAIVTVIAPEIIPELDELVRDGRVHWQQKAYADGDVASFELVICASGDAVANERASQEALAHHRLANVCDKPSSSNFTSPAVMRQGDLMVTVSTNGCSPAMAGWLRRRFQQEYGPSYQEWLQRLAILRQDVKQLIPDTRQRQQFWKTALTEDMMELVRQGKVDAAEAELHKAITAFTKLSDRL